MKKLGLLFMLVAVVGFTASAQKKTHAKKGKYDFLKGETTLNLEFNYNFMTIGRKNTAEDEYVKKKVTEYNKKEAGKGDKWKEGWEGSRESRYEPKFETLINKSMSKAGITASKGAASKYTLVVRTVMIEPGYNIGISKQPAYVNFEFDFIETETKKEVASYILYTVVGSQMGGFDFDSGSRIAESYAKGGKMLGAYINKGVK